MGIEDLCGLLKKKGFRDVYQILTPLKNNTCEKHNFYDELNKFSYYNSFFRIKDELMNRGIIDIQQDDGKKFITLTKKGLEVYKKLEEISDIIEGN